MNAPLRPWWDDLRADAWLCGRQSPERRDTAITADPAFQAVQVARRTELETQAVETAARIDGQGAVMARVIRHHAYFEDRPCERPELLDT